jgi:uncharacterized protein (TIGR03067 family)
MTTRAVQTGGRPRGRAVFMAALTTFVLSAAAFKTTRHARDDRDRLQGKWQVVDARARFGAEPAMDLKDVAGSWTIVVAGDTLTMHDLGTDDSVATYTFVLDTSVSPRRIGMHSQAPATAMTRSGIYRVGIDTLWFALPIEQWSDRPVPPRNFADSNALALILTRSKH